MEVFRHHVYEFRKGVRQLILHTTNVRHLAEMVRVLDQHTIDYVAYTLGVNRVNVFFGHETCVDVVRKIDKPDLRDWSDEEDFILGILLGYDKLQQCGRFLDLRSRREALAG